MGDNTINNSGTNNGTIVGQINIIKPYKIPSLLPIVIQSLAEICAENEDGYNKEDFKPFKPDIKIEYNNVLKYKEIIEKHAMYYSQCEKFLDIYDNSNIKAKSKILNCINNWYMEAKGDVLLENKKVPGTEIDKVRDNSDRIIEYVKNKIIDTVKNSDKANKMCLEDIESGAVCFTCYCFMECKILEKPE